MVIYTQFPHSWIIKACITSGKRKIICKVILTHCITRLVSCIYNDAMRFKKTGKKQVGLCQYLHGSILIKNIFIPYIQCLSPMRIDLLYGLLVLRRKKNP